MSRKWNLKIYELANDTTEMAEMYKRMRGLRGIRPIDKWEGEFAGAEMKQLRSTLRDEYAYTSTWVVLTLGRKHKWKEMFTSYPTSAELKQFCNRCIEELRETRKRYTSTVKTDRRNYMGMSYRVTGGVFTEANTIAALALTVNKRDVIAQSKAPHNRIKDNYVGTELECITQDDRNMLTDRFIAANLHRYVNIKGDSSIQVDPSLGGRTHEIAILCKEQDMKDIITRVCAVLKEAGGYVNDSCGMHMHFDARNRDYLKMYNNMVRMVPLLKSIVPASRRDNRYCLTNNYTNPDSDMNRYQAINPESYRKYKTVEVRLHSGTLNASKILNWFSIIKYAVEHPTILSANITAESFASIFQADARLTKYIVTRQEKFKGTQNTLQDHQDSTVYDVAV